MKNQSGMSALKLIFVIALGILMAGFIGCIGSFVFTGAVITGVATAIHEKQKTQPINNFIKPNQIYTPTTSPQGYIEINGRRTVIYKEAVNQSQVTGQTQSAFINQSMRTSDKVIKDMGNEMLKNTERVQKEAMAKLIKAQNEAKYRK